MQTEQLAPESMEEIMHPGAAAERKKMEAEFPYAPENWGREQAMTMAEAEKLSLDDDHWEALKALQEYFARHKGTTINSRELHDALDENFHVKGGIKYLYVLFPDDPIAQGCRIAGLEPPA